jgi:hemin uptake protein HemP
MEKVNLQKSYSAVNASLAKLFDEAGIKRSFSIPYIQGQAMHEHIQSVGQASSQVGGLTKTLVTTFHHPGGKGWGTDEGITIGHPSDKLKETLIPKDDENAKAVIAAAQKHLNGLKTLLGDDNPVIQTAQGQLDLVKKTDGAGMDLLDFGVMMTQVMYRPHQAVARGHNDQKKTGPNHPKLSLPEQQSSADGQAAPQDGAGAPAGDAAASPAAGEQPEAQPAPAAAVAAPQAQGQ